MTRKIDACRRALNSECAQAPPSLIILLLQWPAIPTVGPLPHTDLNRLRAAFK